MEARTILTRRSALLGTAAATGLLLIGRDRALAADQMVRPDLSSPEGQRMAGLYANAVKEMQNTAINYPPQPHSWTFQAYMHAVPRNPFDPANSGGLRRSDGSLNKRIDEIYGQPAAGTPQAAWKQAAIDCWATCEHASPYFATWHRWYLYYFERICRKLSASADFVLPYWNYGSDNGPSLQLPAPFREVPPQGAPQNVLYFDDRGLGFADGQANGAQNVAMNNGGFLPFFFAQYDPALATKEMFPSDDATNMSFDPGQPAYQALGFSGRVECLPHDTVHSFTGGWMQNVPSAAGDPIFYMHHCQIDRLYASWAALPGASYNFGNSSTQPDGTAWKGKIAAFVNENGQVVKEKLGEAMDTSALNYKYDKLAPPPASAVAAILAARNRALPPLTVAAMESKRFDVKSGGSTVTLEPSAPPGAAPTPSPPAAVAPATSQTLVLRGIKLLRRPPAPLSVFVNLPAGTSPRLNGPYYAGTLNLFNFDLDTGTAMTHGDHAGAGHQAAGPEARFDVTDLLARQRANGQWNGGPVTVTISTIGADSPGGGTYVTIESAAIAP